MSLTCSLVTVQFKRNGRCSNEEIDHWFRCPAVDRSFGRLRPSRSQVAKGMGKWPHDGLRRRSWILLESVSHWPGEPGSIPESSRQAHGAAVSDSLRPRSRMAAHGPRTGYEHGPTLRRSNWLGQLISSSRGVRSYVSPGMVGTTCHHGRRKIFSDRLLVAVVGPGYLEYV
jgi:hypothetical protein